jgi:hypothetical protein
VKPLHVCYEKGAERPELLSSDCNHLLEEYTGQRMQHYGFASPLDVPS